MLRFFKTKSFLIVAVVAALVGLYAILGFVVAPKLVRSALLKQIPVNLAVTPSVGEIHINPFLFQITVNDFGLAGAGGEQLVGFKRLFVDFELSSLWHRAYSFGNIDLSAPYVNAAIAKNGSLNLVQLEPKASAKPAEKAPEKSGPLPALRIGSFKVSDGLATYEDRSRPDAFSARLEPINFELREFTTGVDGGKFTFTGASKQGERIEWHGHLSVDPIASDGEFQVNGLLARTLWEYLQDQLNFVVDSGKIDVAATYKFVLKDPASTAGDPFVQVNVAKLALSDLGVRPRVAAGAAEAAPWVTVPSLEVTGTTVDLSKHQAHVDRVALTGLKLVTWLGSDGLVNLMQLAASPHGGAAGGVPAAGGAPAAPAPKLTATSNATPAKPVVWTYDLGEFDLREANVSAEDRTMRPAVAVVLAPISLTVKGLSQDLTKPLDVNLDLRIDEQGSLVANGKVTPQPAFADLSAKLDGIDLTLVQPYIAQHTAMTLLSGRLAGDAKIHYGKQKNLPGMSLAGNITVQKLHTVDNALRDDFVNWDRLDIQGLNYTQGPDRLDIDKIIARKLYARVIIEADETINAKRVLMLPGADVAPSKAAAAAQAPKVAKTRGKSPAVVASAASPPAAPGMPISIKRVEIKDSQANFADFSVQPNFATGIQKLNGSVVGLSSKPSTRAKVDLHGSIDAFSPVDITGEVNALGPLYTDLKLNFRNISLPVFNPYSGKFAGYNISKGKLTTELTYKIDGRKLDAHHHIVIEQLEFGAKTASKDAVSLPVKLAVSLLKDRNGVIDLDLPVAGTLDDPKFKLGAVIWQVFVHILEKAVTAPFALLGSLFGGGPDIQFVEFKPGASDLDPTATDKAKTIAKALVERPQLKLEVPIGVVPEVDGPALVAAQFDAEMTAEQSAKRSSKKKADGAQPVPYAELDPAAQVDLLSAVYARDFGAAPAFPDEVSSIKSKPDLAAAKAAFLSNAIKAHIVVGEVQFQQLGQQRATALQKALLTDTQLEPERVFLVSNDKAVAKDGVVRLEMSLQ